MGTERTGIDFEFVLIDLRKGDHKKPHFLGLNPAEKLPVLIDGDMALTESGLVEDPERWIRRIIDFIALDWDPRFIGPLSELKHLAS